MTDPLLLITLALGSIVQLGILFHCHQFKNQSALFAKAMKIESDEVKEAINSSVSILEFVADILEDNGAPPNPLQAAMPSMGESLIQTLSQRLMSNMTMGDYGENPSGEIQEVHPTQNEPIQE